MQEELRKGAECQQFTLKAVYTTSHVSKVLGKV